MPSARIPLEITQGATFSKTFRLGTSRLAYRHIEAVTTDAPCVLTVPGHGMPNGWAFKISNCKGMLDLNLSRYYQATVLDEDHVELNDVNAAGFRPYTGGGIITYNVPENLEGCTAASHFRPSVESNEILLPSPLTTENDGIIIDDVNKMITMQCTAVQAAAITWIKSVYDTELRFPLGVVKALAHGPVAVIREVTRD